MTDRQIRAPALIVRGQHSPNNIFVNMNIEGVRNLMGDTLIPKSRISMFHVDNGRNQLWSRAYCD